MNVSDAKQQEARQVTRHIILIVAPITGLIIFFLLIIGCLHFAKTEEEILRLLLMMMSLPLLALTTWSVAILLGWNAIDSSSCSFQRLK